MSRRPRLLVAAVAVAATGLVVTAGPAAALPVSTGSSAYSAAAYTGAATMQASLALTGSLGALLNNLISPIVSTVLNPLVSALQGTASSLVGATLGASGPYHATTPATQSGPAPAAFPGDLPTGLPSPCTAASATLPCYSATTGIATLNVPPLVSLGLTAVSGYTQQVQASSDATSPIFGRAQAAGTSLSVLTAIQGLANPVLSTGTVDAISVCPNDGSTSPSANAAAANVRLLGGLVTFTVASGAIANLVVNGTSYGPVSSLPVVSVAGVVVQPYGSAVEVTLPLTLAQVVAGLGLPTSVATALTGYGTAGASLSLSLVVGPELTITNTSAQAWGLGVGVDLSGSLGFNLLGLVGATVSVPSGIGGANYGNVLDLRLGYTTCKAGAASSGATKVIPPALV